MLEGMVLMDFCFNKKTPPISRRGFSVEKMGLPAWTLCRAGPPERAGNRRPFDYV